MAVSKETKRKLHILGLRVFGGSRMKMERGGVDGKEVEGGRESIREGCDVRWARQMQNVVRVLEASS